MAGGKFAGRRVGREHFRQYLDLDRHQVGGVLGQIRIGCKNHRHRFADIADAVRSEDRLAIRLQSFDAREPEIDRRNICDIRRGPHRDHAICRARRPASMATMRPWAWAERTTRMCN